MDETRSELTKISALTKRMAFKIDKNDMTLSTSYKSLTEISDITDLSMSRVYKWNRNNENPNNQIVGDGLESSQNQDESTESRVESESGTLKPSLEPVTDETGVLLQTEDNEPLDELPVEITESKIIAITEESNPVIEGSNPIIEETNPIIDGSNPNTNPEVSVNDDSKNIDSNEFSFLTEQIPTEVVEPCIIVSASIENIDVTTNPEELQPDSEEIFKARQILLLKIHEAMKVRRKVTSINDELQTKLMNYYRKRRPDAALKMQKILQKQETAIIDVDQRYAKYQTTVLELQNELQSTEQDWLRINTVKKEEKLEKDEEIKWKTNEFTEYRHGFALIAANSHTGKKISAHEWELMILSEKKKWTDVQVARLENIKLLHKVSKLKTAIVAKECVGNKLNLLDFEQIKIENHAYYEKLADGKEAIRRLEIKIRNNIHILTHMKEKIVYMMEVVQKERENVTAKIIVNTARKSLTRVKRARDEVAQNNDKMRRMGGLLNNKMLLKHFEDTEARITVQRNRISQMTDIISATNNQVDNEISIKS